MACWFMSKNPAAVPAIAMKYGSRYARFISMKTWVLNWSQSVAVLNTGLAWIKPPPIADSSTVSIVSSFLRLDFPGSECLKSNFHKPMPMNTPPAPSQISLFSKSHLLTGIKFEFCSTGVQ